jgi:hypothetical protein
MLFIFKTRMCFQMLFACVSVQPILACIVWVAVQEQPPRELGMLGDLWYRNAVFPSFEVDLPVDIMLSCHGTELKCRGNGS